MITNEQIETLKGKFKKDAPVLVQANNGKVDVEAYLNFYGIRYKVKQNDQGTLYALDECLFDPAHKTNEASIIQLSDGKLLYQCFHNSCQGKGWKDARERISGKDSLAQFMEGRIGIQNKVEKGNPTEVKKIESKPPFITPASILNDDGFDEVKPDLVEGTIKEGSLILLSGLPGHMKTFIAIAFGIGVTTSGIFISRRAKKCKAFYFDKENPKGVWRKRLRQLMKESDAENFFIWTYWQTPEPPIIKKPEGDIYIELAKNNPGSLFVFDSLIKFYPKGTNENSATDISPVMAMFREMTKYDVTVLVLHHRGKDGSMDYRGTTEILASVDLAYAVDKHENRLTLKCLKDRYNQERNIEIDVKEDIDGYLFFEDVSAQEREREYQEKTKVMKKLQDIIKEMLQKGIETNQTKIIEYAKLILNMGKKKLPELLEAGINRYWYIVKGTKGHKIVFTPTIGEDTHNDHSQHTDNVDKKYCPHLPSIYIDGDNGVDTPDMKVSSPVQMEDTHNGNDVNAYNYKGNVLSPQGKNTIGNNGEDTQEDFTHEEDEPLEINDPDSQPWGD